MKKYICTSEPKDTGKAVAGFLISIPKRGLFWSKEKGKHVYLRDSLEDPEPQFELYKFKTIEQAQELCDEVNKAHDDNFKVEEL